MSKISTSDAEHHEPSIVALSFRRGTIAAATVASISFGLKMLGVSDLWFLIAALSIIAAWVVGYCSAIIHLLRNLK